jgi:hypothetical protein
MSSAITGKKQQTPKKRIVTRLSRNEPEEKRSRLDDGSVSDSKRSIPMNCLDLLHPLGLVYPNSFPAPIGIFGGIYP